MFFTLNILNNFKISTRIFILALFPTIIICALSSSYLYYAIAQEEVLAELSLAMGLAKQSGGVLKELQSERDYTALFITTSNKKRTSNADKFTVARSEKNQLDGQRRTVDQAIENFKSYVASSGAIVKENPRVINLLNSFDGIAETRSYIDRLELKTDKGIWVVNYYVNTNQRALDIVNGAIKYAADNKELSLLLGSYAALMQLDSIYSSERGSKLRTFNQKSIDYTSHSNNKGVRLQIINASSRFRAYAPVNINQAFERDHMETVTQKKLFDLRFKILNLGGKTYNLTADQWFKDSSENIASLRKVISFVEHEIAQQSELSLNEAESAVSQSILLMIFVVLAIIVISYFIIRSIITPLETLVSGVSEVANNKDVSNTMSVTGKDELAEVTLAFNSLQENFNAALLGVRNEVTNLNELTTSVSGSMQGNQKRATSQNEATDSVSVAVNEMSATIEEVAKIAQSTATAVSNAHESSVTSSKNANDSKDIMEQLVGELANTQEQVTQLNTESEVIGNVLGVIQSIAEQTNLLALNAAIEAARAGEQGRGFAVVADEVRSLASRTQESTEQIRQQIEALQKGSRSATNSMEHLQQQGLKAVEVVVSSVAAFDVLREELDNIFGMSSQIATAAEEQTLVANEINERIHGIKDDTEEMSQHTDSTVDACDDLKNTGSKLGDYVSEFTVRAKS